VLLAAVGATVLYIPDRMCAVPYLPYLPYRTGHIHGTPHHPPRLTPLSLHRTALPPPSHIPSHIPSHAIPVYQHQPIFTSSSSTLLLPLPLHLHLPSPISHLSLLFSSPHDLTPSPDRLDASYIHSFARTDPTTSRYPFSSTFIPTAPPDTRLSTRRKSIPPGSSRIFQPTLGFQSNCTLRPRSCSSSLHHSRSIAIKRNQASNFKRYPIPDTRPSP